MGYHDFQHNTDKGGINVQFNVEFEGNEQHIRYINIHSSYKTGLPQHPEIRKYRGEDAFYWEFYTRKDGEIVSAYQYISNDLTDILINKIRQRIKEDWEKQPKTTDNG